jgi:enamidase
MANVLIKNIGTLVSGNIDRPFLEADAIWIEEGVVRKVGSIKDVDEKAAQLVVDCAGTTVTPGLIDSHVHPVLGDFTPRQKQLDFLDSELHGGVTTAVSAGEVHLPGRPKDPAGTKALAILAAKAFAGFRPGGMKVLGGALILEKGLTEKDFEECAREGVRTVGEIGLGSVKSPADAAPMVKWAKKNGMVVLMHTGGTSIPGSSTVGLEQVLGADPDIVCHLNGGPTAASLEEAEKLVTQTSMAIELVHCGNMKAAVEIGGFLTKHNALHRGLIGNDAPSGTGVVPLGVLRVLSLLAGMTPIKPEQAVCMATGNTARIHKLNRGVIAEGKEADLVVMDTPMGSVGKDALSALAVGDIPAVSMVIVDGKIAASSSRNTPPPVKKPAVTK